MNVLITGASGFVGSNIMQVLSQSSSNFLIGVSNNNEVLVQRKNIRNIKIDLSKSFDLKSILKQVDVIIHAAGVAHNNFKRTDADVEHLNRVNVQSTIELANQAAKSGVRRFILLSSIGVHGSNSDVALSEVQKTSPTNAYTRSKQLAEEGLISVASKNNMEYVILRPPMVYGKDAPGNFSLLTKIVKFPIPLPFKNIRNLRSFIYIENLVDIVSLCTIHINAGNEIFLVADADSYSTSDFLHAVIDASKTRATLFPFPVILMRMIANSLGKKTLADSLFGNLYADSSKIRNQLSWIPPVKFENAITKSFKS